MCLRVCGYYFLFCDQDGPCALSKINKYSEHYLKGPHEENPPSVYRYKFCRIIGRIFSFLTSFYCRTNPCQCLKGCIGCEYLHERHQISSRTGIIIISLTKILVYTSLCVYFGSGSLIRYYIWQYNSHKIVREIPPTGVEWSKLREEKADIISLFLFRRAFCSYAFTTILYGITDLMYFVLLLGTIYRRFSFSYCYLLSLFIPVCGAAYLPIQYEYFHSVYTLKGKTDNETVIVNLNLLDTSDDLEEDKANEPFQPTLHYIIWISSVALLPYEIWLIIYNMRTVQIERFRRLGVVSDYLKEDDVFLYNEEVLENVGERNRDRAPAMTEASYVLAEEYLFDQVKFFHDHHPTKGITIMRENQPRLTRSASAFYRERNSRRLIGGDSNKVTPLLNMSEAVRRANEKEEENDKNRDP